MGNKAAYNNRANQLNPQHRAFHSSRAHFSVANRANQLNPDHAAYHSSRAHNRGDSAGSGGGVVINAPDGVTGVGPLRVVRGDYGGQAPTLVPYDFAAILLGESGECELHRFSVLDEPDGPVAATPQAKAAFVDLIHDYDDSARRPGSMPGAFKVAYGCLQGPEGLVALRHTCEPYFFGRRLTPGELAQLERLQVVGRAAVRSRAELGGDPRRAEVLSRWADRRTRSLGNWKLRLNHLSLFQPADFESFFSMREVQEALQRCRRGIRLEERATEALKRAALEG